MPDSLCQMIAKKINQNKIDEEEEILAFGIHYLINYLILFSTAILLGLLTNSLLEIFLFLLVILPIRSVQGGIHFENNLVCFIISVSFCIVPYFLTFVNFNHQLLFAFSLLSIFVLLIMDVLANKNNPMTDVELTFLNKRARRLELFYLGLIILFQLKHIDYWGCFINNAVIVSAISFCLGFITNKYQAIN